MLEGYPCGGTCSGADCTECTDCRDCVNPDPDCADPDPDCVDPDPVCVDPDPDATPEVDATEALLRVPEATLEPEVD